MLYRQISDHFVNLGRIKDPRRKTRSLEMGKFTSASDIDKKKLDDVLEYTGILNDDEQTAIILKYYAGLKINEISETMGTPRRTIERYINRAKIKIREELKE